MNRLAIILLLARCAAGQTLFPGSVDTDASLGVARNFVSTRLAQSVSAGASSIVVRSASNIVLNQFLAIGSTEIVQVSGVSGTSISVTRGVDGTAAVTHAAGEVVADIPVAAHHNRLKDAVIAVQQVVGNGVIGGGVYASSYNYSAQTPGGALLAGGVGQTIAFNPLPAGLGIGGTVYISGGTGTAEAVTVTNVVGSAVTVSAPAYAHSGSWTVRSASSGIQESVAVTAAAGGGIVVVAAGTHPLYATLQIGNGSAGARSTYNGVKIRGQGMKPGASEAGIGGGTTLLWNGAAAQPMVQINGPIGDVELMDMALDCNGATQCSYPIVSSHGFRTHLNRLLITEHPTFGVVQTAFATPPSGVAVGDSDSVYENLVFDSGGVTATSGGLLIGDSAYGGSPNLDVARAEYRNIQILCGGAGSVGIQLQFTDALTFQNVFTLGCAKPLNIAPPSGSTLFPGGIAFYNAMLIGTTTTATFVASTWSGGTKVGFFPFHTGDSEAIPTHPNFYGVTDQNISFGGGEIFTSLKSFGALCDGSTNDTAALQAALDAIQTAGGGTLYLPVSANPCRIDGQITIANSGGARPYQKPLKIQGAGDSTTGITGTRQNTSVLDMRYSGSGSKFRTLGTGKLELANFGIIDGSTSNATSFFLVTMTTLHAHDLSIEGSVSGTGTTQDVFVLGGPNFSVTGSVDDMFQGYGTVIERNYFDKVRRSVWARTAANGVVVQANTIGAGGGGDAAIFFEGQSGAPNVKIDGGVIAFNVIELTGYTAGIKLDYANKVQILANNLYDTVVGVSIYGIHLTANAQYHTTICGTHTNGSGFTPYYDAARISVAVCATDQAATNTPSYLNHLVLNEITAFAGLGTATKGKVLWCSNCTVATPCTGAGSGAWAFANGTRWACPF